MSPLFSFNLQACQKLLLVHPYTAELGFSTAQRQVCLVQLYHVAVKANDKKVANDVLSVLKVRCSSIKLCVGALLHFPAACHDSITGELLLGMLHLVLLDFVLKVKTLC